MWCPTLVGEDNKPPFIRVWKPSPSRRVLKPWGETRKGSPKRTISASGGSGSWHINCKTTAFLLLLSLQACTLIHLSLCLQRRKDLRPPNQKKVNVALVGLIFLLWYAPLFVFLYSYSNFIQCISLIYIYIHFEFWFLLFVEHFIFAKKLMKYLNGVKAWTLSPLVKTNILCNINKLPSLLMTSWILVMTVECSLAFFFTISDIYIISSASPEDASID